MNFYIEIILVSFIIYLLYLIFSIKQNQPNVDTLYRENDILKDQLNQKSKEFSSREQNLNQTIANLQISFRKEQDSIRQIKLELKSKEEDLIEKLLDIELKLKTETETRKKVISQKKSSEVRLGGIAETLAPFLDQFEFDPENCTFLGKPIDYISFGDEEITLIEVKSGKSKLNAKQRHIRDLVKSNLVSWKEIRIE